jgi:hypothetical protein
VANTLTCKHCGTALRTAAGPLPPKQGLFCSAGCGLLGHIPIDKDGQFPVNAALLAGLAIGLLYFNEALFALLARAAVQHARSDTAVWFQWLSSISGGLVWLGVAVVHWRLQLTGKRDKAALLITLAVMGTSCHQLPPAPMEIIGANTILLAWSARGLIKKRFTRKNAVRI